MSTPVTSYVTLTDVKNHLGLAPSDSADDAVLATKIVSASRAIDAHCRRRFWRDPADNPATVRYFRPDSACWCPIDDLIVDADTVIALDSDDTGTWATAVTATDYITHPLNGVGSDGQLGWPVTALELVNTSLYFYPDWAHLNVKVTGRWGWAAVPQNVKEACLIVTADLFHYKDVRGGTLGFNEFGPLRVTGAVAGHAKALLHPYGGMQQFLVA